jgi:hypothetical protein
MTGNFQKYKLREGFPDLTHNESDLETDHAPYFLASMEAFNPAINEQKGL